MDSAIKRILQSAGIYFGGFHLIGAEIYLSGYADPGNPTWELIYSILRMELFLFKCMGVVSVIVVFVVLAQLFLSSSLRNGATDTTVFITQNLIQEPLEPKIPVAKKIIETLQPPKELSPNELKEMAIKEILGG